MFLTQTASTDSSKCVWPVDLPVARKSRVERRRSHAERRTSHEERRSRSAERRNSCKASWAFCTLASWASSSSCIC